MARIASFPSRAVLKSVAEEACRFALTHAIYESKKVIEGIERKVEVDFELNAVFISWIDPEYGSKTHVEFILKAWGGKGRDWQPEREEAQDTPSTPAAVEVVNEYTAIKIDAAANDADARKAIESDWQVSNLTLAVNDWSTAAAIESAAARDYLDRVLEITSDAPHARIRRDLIACNAIIAQERAALRASFAIEDRFALLQREADIRATPFGWRQA